VTVRLYERSMTTWKALRTMQAARRTPYLTRARAQALCDQRVRDLVAYATANVPYYRDMVMRGELDPQTITAAHDLERLPLIEKDDLRSAPERFESLSSEGRSTQRFLTSGATGIPLGVRYDREALIVNAALGVHTKAVARTVCGKRSPVALRFGHPLATGPQVKTANRELMLLPRSPRPAMSVEEPLERAAEEIERVRPDIVSGYGSYLEALFRFIGNPSALEHRPRAVSYHANSMSTDGRQLIEEHFGIAVLGSYSATECFRIGYRCEASAAAGFHVHEDVCHVGIVDSSGRRLDPGEEGEVVISNLFNRATVLLNYRIGDIGALTTEPCVCGRTSPRILGLEGRVDELIHLADGRVVHPISVSVAVLRTPVVQFQLAQLTGDRFELRLVTNDQDSFERASRDALSELQELLGGALVVARRCDKVETSGRGKVRRVLTLRSRPEEETARVER
jgi:phenylacetate-CoA ligase